MARGRVGHIAYKLPPIGVAGSHDSHFLPKLSKGYTLKGFKYHISFKEFIYYVNCDPMTLISIGISVTWERGRKVIGYDPRDRISDPSGIA